LKGCPCCKFFDQWYCTIAGEMEDIPPSVYGKGCKKFKKNKRIMF